ncbi:MAG: DinB family protein [Phycisphaeraceae bacterium]
MTDPARAHSSASVSTPPDGPAAATIVPLLSLLDELAVVLRGLDHAQYVCRPVAPMTGSVGGHVRHSLDHLRAWASAGAMGRIDYEKRQRDTAVEHDRQAALAEIALLRAAVAAMATADLAMPVRVTVMMGSDQPPLELMSSLGREAAFVLSHTIHHNAIIGAMVRSLGGLTPATFGYAPSTLAYLKQSPCAR